LEELKHLLAHNNFEGRINVLVEQLADMALDKLRPREPKSAESQVVSQQKPTSPAPGIEKMACAGVRQERSRYIPVGQRRQVLLRDRKGCTYKDPKSGRVCGSRHGLQFDHIVPFGLGGQNSAQNLTLRCGAHNRFLAEQMRLFRPQLRVRGTG
jgi:hypothetical protein